MHSLKTTGVLFLFLAAYVITTSGMRLPERRQGTGISLQQQSPADVHEKLQARDQFVYSKTDVKEIIVFAGPTSNISRIETHKSPRSNTTYGADEATDAAGSSLGNRGRPNYHSHGRSVGQKNGRPTLAGTAREFGREEPEENGRPTLAGTAREFGREEPEEIGRPTLAGTAREFGREEPEENGRPTLAGTAREFGREVPERRRIRSTIIKYKNSGKESKEVGDEDVRSITKDTDPGYEAEYEDDIDENLDDVENKEGKWLADAVFYDYQADSPSVPLTSEEEEECPPVPEILPPGACSVEECRSDRECYSTGRKCCYNGCTYTCMTQLIPAPFIDWIREPKRHLKSGGSWLIPGPSTADDSEPCSTTPVGEDEDPLLCPHGYVCSIEEDGDPVNNVPNSGRCVPETNDSPAVSVPDSHLSSPGKNSSKNSSGE